MAYDHKEIEKLAREKWAVLDLYKTDLSVSPPAGGELYYLLVEFPYPSGDLHIGHWYAFAITDIYARLLRARGKNVLFPIGFDAFGLPAENAAMKNGVDPAKWTYENMSRMREQLASMGASFDWSKEVVTCDPSYYQWTQWLFAKLFEHNLAERREAAVKWCPKDQTVLANEQVVDGACERCGTQVEEKRLTQWFLKITNYAEKLLTGLDALPWREEIKDAQRAWIGKSEGAKLKFELLSQGVALPQGDAFASGSIEVFTTRPDTIFGATYVVLAPEHPLIEGLTKSLINSKEVMAYVEATKKKTERERSENKEKTGVKLEGVMATNPATKEEIPIYVADYVLGSYGTGAVMAVPAHDERDYEFAQKFNLPVRRVIEPLLIQTTDSSAFKQSEPYVDHHGVMAIIKHWSNNTYLALGWKKAPDWGTLLTGSLDDGLSPEETVLKEIHEETGYVDANLVKKLGVIHGKYFHVPKNANRFGHATAFYVELRDEKREVISEEEASKHVLKWLSLEELKHFLTALSHKAAVALYENGVYTENGILANSGEFNGKNSEDVKWDIVKYAGGERATQYRIRDWLVSRQRYWGCPIPIVYDPSGKPHAVPAEHLPWLLPTDVDFKPTGKAPLASSDELRERVTRIFGEGWTPEYDTLDTFVDSSWYFLRYLDSKDTHNFSDASLMKKWLPINRYSGGSEHTTMHLLYARFFMKALYDLALVPVDEPFTERYNRGLIMGPDGQKMSKSKGNVVNPDEFVEKYGADAVRLYLAFIGPYNEPRSYPWSLDGVASMRKFLDRVERFVVKNQGKGNQKMRNSLTKHFAITANKITTDANRFKFNTCVAFLMTILSMFEKEDVPRDFVRQFVIMLAPFAPHLAEHLWEKLGGEGSVHQQSWPEALVAVASEVEVVVQVGGRRRGSIRISPSAEEAEVLSEALKIPAVKTALAGKEPKRVIYIPNKIINLVVPR